MVSFSSCHTCLYSKYIMATSLWDSAKPAKRIKSVILTFSPTIMFVHHISGKQVTDMENVSSHGSTFCLRSKVEAHKRNIHCHASTQIPTVPVTLTAFAVHLVTDKLYNVNLLLLLLFPIEVSLLLDDIMSIALCCALIR